MAGFVFGLLGRAPEPGDEVSHDGMRFEVVEVEGSRIDRLAVTFEQRRRDRERDGDAASEPTGLEHPHDA
jgi:CBS domain containing-hemolysin-like protein